MRKLVAVVGISVGLLAMSGSPADAFAPINIRQAEDQASSLMRQEALWRYRTEGQLDCRRGRISGTEWSCRVWMRKGSKCGVGRIRVIKYYDYYYRDVRFNSYLRGRKYRC